MRSFLVRAALVAALLRTAGALERRKADMSKIKMSTIVSAHAGATNIDVYDVAGIVSGDILVISDDTHAETRQILAVTRFRGVQGEVMFAEPLGYKYVGALLEITIETILPPAPPFPEAEILVEGDNTAETVDAHGTEAEKVEAGKETPEVETADDAQDEVQAKAKAFAEAEAMTVSTGPPQMPTVSTGPPQMQTVSTGPPEITGAYIQTPGKGAKTQGKGGNKGSEGAESPAARALDEAQNRHAVPKGANIDMQGKGRKVTNANAKKEVQDELHAAKEAFVRKGGKGAKKDHKHGKKGVKFPTLGTMEALKRSVQDSSASASSKVTGGGAIACIVVGIGMVGAAAVAARRHALKTPSTASERLKLQSLNGDGSPWRLTDTTIQPLNTDVTEPGPIMLKEGAPME